MVSSTDKDWLDEALFCVVDAETFTTMPGWYFYDESWCDTHGPFATRGEAIENLVNYIEKELSSELCLKPDDWLQTPKYQGLTIMDPDGWDRKNYQQSWNEKISWQEFEKRAAESTCLMKDPFLSRLRGQTSESASPAPGTE